MRGGCAVLAAVLWAGRQADPNAAVDGEVQQAGLVSIDSNTGTVTLLAPSKALLSSIDDEVKALVRSRLESFAEVGLGGCVARLIQKTDVGGRRSGG